MGLGKTPYSLITGRQTSPHPASPVVAPALGHSHFWERAMSRRGLLKTTGGLAAAAVGARFLPPRFGGMASAAAAASGASGADPRPIPGGIMVAGQGYHVFPPGRQSAVDPNSPTNEPSTITDFDGVVALTQTQGTGLGQENGVESRLNFDSDMRFIQGRYIGMDGRLHEATFGFV